LRNALALLLALWLSCVPAASSSVMARIDRATATGVGKPAFVIDLFRGVGFDVSLLATGETIADWWVEDPSRVVARTDRSGRILSLRLVDLPAVVPSNRNWTTLKVLAGDPQGRLSLLHFVVRFQERPPPRAEHVRYHGLEVLPAAPAPASTGPTPLR
jgi:hypothetical protein